MNPLETLEFNLRKRSPRTKQAYLWIARLYLEFSPNDYSRTAMLRFMEHLELRKFSPNSRRLAHYALSRLCRSLEVKFPLDGDDLAPPPDESELNTPTLSNEQVGALIGYAKGWPGAYYTSLLFLSTLYGIRSVEMTDVEIGEGAIRVFMAKKRKREGRPPTRVHILPDNGALFLSSYRPAPEWKVIEAFHEICLDAGVKTEGGAWHQIKRSLNTQLRLAGVEPEIVRRFLRWSADRQDMSSVYFHIKPEEIDRMAFAKHPFLSSWGLSPPM